MQTDDSLTPLRDSARPLVVSSFGLRQPAAALEEAACCRCAMADTGRLNIEQISSGLLIKKLQRAAAVQTDAGSLEFPAVAIAATDAIMCRRLRAVLSADSEYPDVSNSSTHRPARLQRS